MKVLCLTYYFPPEIGSGPHLPFEMCETLAKRGHEVSVVTSFPRYHVEAMPPQYRQRMFYREELGGAQVYRINAPNLYTQKRYLRGAIQQISPWMLAFQALRLEKPDVVFTATPPLGMGSAARLVANRFGIPCVVNVQDLFPQCAVDLGLLHNRTLIRIFERVERRLYRKADAVVVMSDGNRDFVIAKGARPERVHTIFNWVDTDLIRPGERMNDFRKKHGLGDDFIVLFAGTMGWSQGMDTIIDAARLLTDQPGLQFLIVGDGVEKERLQKRSQGLPNVRYLPMQSKAVYPQVVAAADVALVTLRPEVATPTVPSKIATIMSAGRPIVASIPLCGDLPKIIAQAESGVVAPAADGRALAEAILALKRDPERARRLGINGRHFAETQLSRQVCVGQIEDLFQRLISEKRKTHSASSFSGNTDALIIRPARYEDLDDVVRIHLAAFGSRFNLPALGPRFLKRYYELVLNFESKVFMVAECDGKVAGFVAGFINSGGFYAHMRRNKWRLAIAAARAIPADPSVIPRLIHIAERMKGALKRPDALNVQSSKLASIAVDPALGRKGLGKKLVYAFLEEARRQGADDVYLTTDAKKNHAVNEFYRGLGFTLSSSFRAPKQRVLNEYCKSLLDSTNSVAPVQK